MSGKGGEQCTKMTLLELRKIFKTCPIVHLWLT